MKPDRELKGTARGAKAPSTPPRTNAAKLRSAVAAMTVAWGLHSGVLPRLARRAEAPAKPRASMPHRQEAAPEESLRGHLVLPAPDSDGAAAEPWPESPALAAPLLPSILGPGRAAHDGGDPAAGAGRLADAEGGADEDDEKPAKLAAAGGQGGRGAGGGGGSAGGSAGPARSVTDSGSPLRAAAGPPGQQARRGMRAAMDLSSIGRTYRSWPTMRQLAHAFAADAAAYDATMPGAWGIARGGGLPVAGVRPSASHPGGASSGAADDSDSSSTPFSGSASGSGGSGAPSTGGGRKRADADIPWRPLPPGRKSTLFPDVSVWRKVRDWKALSKASRGIIGMKVRQVSIDPTFHENLEDAEKHGMIVLGYAFGYGTSGKNQADALLKNFPPRPGRVLVLDLERNPYGSSMTTAQAIDFVERIKQRSGRYPVVYASASRPRPGALAKCPRWVAAWGGAPPKGAAIWQFTDGVTGKKPHSFPGVGSCDINKLLVSYETLRSWAGLDPMVARK